MKSGIRPKTTAADILGRSRRPPAASRPEPTSCPACGQKLSNTRVLALRKLETTYTKWACVRCAETVITPKLGLFMGEVGTSELKLVDHLYSDSVRDVFTTPDAAEEEQQ